MTKLIIFDLDDTLIDSFDANFNAYEKACNDLGISILKEDYKKTRGMSWKDSIPHFTGIKDFEKIDKIHELKKKYLYEFFHHIKEIENNIILKDLLKEKYKLCIATSASRKNVDVVDKKFNLKKDFDFIVTSDDVKNGKPAPDLFLKCAQIFNVSPEDCFVIDDSDSGVIAAKKAGMKVFRVPLNNESSTQQT